ncbi:cation-translocating P-type ATPase [Candidatus Roizmanbacteria bacterium]|nr:cation-translocating P-type ATPase [Candidatus Roizmanbacteria bacterium]
MDDSHILNKHRGLTEKQVREKIREEGYNELPSQKKQNIFEILLNVVREPMLIMLIACGTIYLFLGEAKDALMLLTFVGVVIGITFYQERKTERALEALRDLSSPRALVIREGRQIRVSGREVVTEDILILREGDRVPADAVILSSSNLLVDESLLTGESLPVRKTEWDGKTKNQSPGGDDLPFIYSGTLVTQGRGIAKVISTGLNTEMGKIGKALSAIKEEETLLKKETNRLVKNFALIGILLCVIVVMVYGFVRGDWLKGFLSGLTLSMAMLPEEFSVVLVIFLTLGAWRISKRKVLTRHTAAIETLGAAKTLCVDKTGTLTLNRMTLVSLMGNGSLLNLDSGKKTGLPESYHPLMEYAILASQRDPFDPIEKEIKKVGEERLGKTEHIHSNWHLVKEYPLSKKLLSLSHVWESEDKTEYIIAAKGAPETIIDLCHLNKKESEKIEKKIQEMSNQGLRLIGVAKAYFKKTTLPDNQHDFEFKFIGLLGFIDPVRSTVKEAVSECYRAGIRVCMITGDYPGTASHIAKQIGLENPTKVITGAELQRLDHLQLREKIKNTNVFARVVPEQKLLIVNALKANGEIVAMTGDGVNDAPALKSAHIGIAMGERGTDVAREASDLVLLNDDFSAIVQAVKMGRRIFDNLKKAMAYIFAVHIPIAGISLLPIVFNLPVVLLPAHIAFLELIIDPACSVVFESEKEEYSLMHRPPRNLYEPLFDKKAMIVSFVQGVSILVMTFLVFISALYMKKGEGEARTLTFATLVFANLGLIVTNLSWTENFIKILQNKNKALLWVLTGTALSLILIISVPFLKNIFHFTNLHPEDLLVTFTVGLISILWFEGLKIYNNLRQKTFFTS